MDKERKPDRQLTLMKIQTAATVGILVVVLLFVLFCAVKLNGVITQLQDLDLQQLNEAVASFKNVSDNLAKVDTEAINEGIQGLSDAAEQLEELDVSKLNRFMNSLDGVADQMDAASEVLKGIFGK